MLVTDGNENYKPDKKKSKERIDPMVAMFNAFHLYMKNGTTQSVYENTRSKDEYKMGLFNRNKIKAATVKEIEWINSLLDEYGSTTSSSGVRISSDTALKVAAVYSCVKVISNQIAQLPLDVYKTTDKGRIKDKEHPVHNLIHTQFNEYTVAFLRNKASHNQCITYRIWIHND